MNEPNESLAPQHPVRLVKITTERERALLRAAEMLWVMLANVSEGDWKKQSPDWQEHAAPLA